MLRNRLVALALFAARAPAQDLESKLEAKQSKLDEVREMKGVLTSTISHYGDQIDRLTGEVADIRGREEAVRTRLAAKQAELSKAVADLDVAKDRLVELRSRLKRALGALRDRLVAMYETGAADVLSVIVGATGVDDLAARAEYLDRLHGMDEAVVGRVRELRDQVQRVVDRLRTTKDQIEAARDAIATEEQALVEARAALQSHQQELVAARGRRVAALAQIGEHEEELDGDVAAIQGKIAAQLSATGSGPLPGGPPPGAGRRRGGRRDPGEDRRSTPRHRLGAAPGGPDPGRQRRPDLAGGRTGRLALRRPGHRRRLRVPPGNRHRGPGRNPDPRRRRRLRDLHPAGGQQRRLRQLHVHRPWRWALHLLRPPELLRGLRRPVRLAGGHHRLHRLHRILPRPPPSFRGSNKWLRHRPDGLPLAIGNPP